MINRCFLSFWLANARSIQQNIHHPNFFVSELKSALTDSLSLTRMTKEKEERRRKEEGEGREAKEREKTKEKRVSSPRDGSNFRHREETRGEKERGEEGGGGRNIPPPPLYARTSVRAGERKGERRR